MRGQLILFPTPLVGLNAQVCSRHSDRYIARRLKVTPRQVRTYRAKHGYARKHTWKIPEVKFIVKALGVYTDREIARMYATSANAVAHARSRYGSLVVSRPIA